MGHEIHNFLAGVYSGERLNGLWAPPLPHTGSLRAKG
jgi:hypothetical protein